MRSTSKTEHATVPTQNATVKGLRNRLKLVYLSSILAILGLAAASFGTFLAGTFNFVLIWACVMAAVMAFYLNIKAYKQIRTEIRNYSSMQTQDKK